MTENRCRFCLEEYPVPSLIRYCEERHLKAIQSIQGRSWLGLRELKNLIGGELTTRIEKAVLGTLRDTRHRSNRSSDKYFIGHVKGHGLVVGHVVGNAVRGRVWWENPNLQDIPVLISLGIPPQLMEQIEEVECRNAQNCTSRLVRKKRSGLRLKGLSSDPEKVIAKLI